MRADYTKGDELDQKAFIAMPYFQTQRVSDGEFREVTSNMCVFTPKESEDAPNHPCAGETS